MMLTTPARTSAVLLRARAPAVRGGAGGTRDAVVLGVVGLVLAPRTRLTQLQTLLREAARQALTCTQTDSHKQL
jgi:hypothetical protein